jgi:hypothetical protein
MKECPTAPNVNIINPNKKECNLKRRLYMSSMSFMMHILYPFCISRWHVSEVAALYKTYFKAIRVLASVDIEWCLLSSTTFLKKALFWQKIFRFFHNFDRNMKHVLESIFIEYRHRSQTIIHDRSMNRPKLISMIEA